MPSHVRFACALCLLLSACSTGGLSDSVKQIFSGAGPVIKRAPGERTDVVFAASHVSADPQAADTPVVVPPQENQPEWLSINAAMQVPHLGLTGIGNETTAHIGDGNRFSRAVVAAPVVTAHALYAMDAAGVVSSHSTQDITNILWRNAQGVNEDQPDALGGGVAFNAGVVYASTGLGSVRAINAKDGTTLWSVNVGAPVHGAPGVSDRLLVVLTADNQAIALDAATGAPRWTHRGIRESAAYYAITSPVIAQGLVVAAYNSGEVFVLREETGNVVWSDTLTSPVRTQAASFFSGIDADPVVGEGVVVVATAGGAMQASVLLNGQPLWQQQIGTHTTPWSAGNVLYALTENHDLVALLKANGAVRWVTPLTIKNERDPTRDETPALFGPILAGNAVFVLDARGQLMSFKPETGERLGTYDISGDVVSAPLVSGGALYYVTKDARLHQYRGQ